MGEMGLPAATAQDPVNGKSLGGLKMGLGDRDQASSFHRLSSLAVQNGLSSPEPFRKRRPPAPLSPTTPGVGSAANSGHVGRVKNVATPVAGEVCSTHLADRRRRAGVNPVDQADRAQRQRALLTHSGPQENQEHERDRPKAETHWRSRNIFARRVELPSAATVNTGAATGSGIAPTVNNAIGKLTQSNFLILSIWSPPHCLHRPEKSARGGKRAPGIR